MYMSVRGTVHPKIKKVLNFEDISCTDVGLPAIIMDSDGTSFEVLKAAIKCLFPEIMTQLLEIIHRPRCEQFSRGAADISTANIADVDG